MLRERSAINGPKASDYTRDTAAINNDGSEMAFGAAISVAGNGGGVRVVDDSL